MEQNSCSTLQAIRKEPAAAMHIKSPEKAGPSLWYATALALSLLMLLWNYSSDTTVGWYSVAWATITLEGMTGMFTPVIAR